MAEMSKKACEAKGWFWIARKRLCSEPDLGPVKLTLTRGALCKGRTWTSWIRKPLPPDVKRTLLKAAIKARQARLKGN